MKLLVEWLICSKIDLISENSIHFLRTYWYSAVAGFQALKRDLIENLKSQYNTSFDCVPMDSIVRAWGKRISKVGKSSGTRRRDIIFLGWCRK